MKEYEEIRKLWQSKELPSRWIKDNSIVIDLAMRHKMAIAGSFAVGLSTKNPHKEPGDIDFVCESPTEAMEFISALALFLAKKNVHYQIRSNNNNEYMAPLAINHFRLFCPFWKEICIMVIPKVDFYYWKGLRIQLYKSVRAAMEAIEIKSPKGRLNIILDDDPILPRLAAQSCQSSPDTKLSINTRTMTDKQPPPTEQPTHCARLSPYGRSAFVEHDPDRDSDRMEAQREGRLMPKARVNFKG